MQKDPDLRLRALQSREAIELLPMGQSIVRPLRELCHYATAERDAARARFDGVHKPRTSK